MKKLKIKIFIFLSKFFIQSNLFFFLTKYHSKSTFKICIFRFFFFPIQNLIPISNEIKMPKFCKLISSLIIFLLNYNYSNYKHFTNMYCQLLLHLLPIRALHSRIYCFALWKIWRGQRRFGNGESRGVRSLTSGLTHHRN